MKVKSKRSFKFNFPSGVRPSLDDALCWAESIARRRAYSNEDIDEMVQAARIAAWEKWEDFDESLGNRYHTHALARVMGAILDARRLAAGQGMKASAFTRRHGRLKVASLDALRGEGEAPMSELLVSDDEPVGWEVETEDRIQWLLGGLPRQHQGVLGLILGWAGTTRAESASEMGVSESRASQVYSEAVRMLRDRFAEHPKFFAENT